MWCSIDQCASLHSTISSTLSIYQSRKSANLGHYSANRRWLFTVSYFDNTLISKKKLTFPFSYNLAYCFFSNYQNADDLHIGLTDSKSNVYEFDHKGVHVGTRNRSWNNCLNISIISKTNQTWNDFWDYNLNILVEMPIWKPENYSEEDNNCYSFVITFLRLLQIKALRSSLSGKTQFCKDYIVPRTKNAAKYIALYRQVVKEGITIINTKWCWVDWN